MNPCVDLGPQHTAQTIRQLKVLHHRSESIASHLGVQCVDDDLDIVPGQRVVQGLSLQALKGHDRRNLAFRDQLLAEIEQGREVGGREIVRLVRVWVLVGRVGDVARWGAAGHQRVAGKGHVFIVGLGYRSTTEIVGVFATRSLQTARVSLKLWLNGRDTYVRIKSIWS